MIYMTELASPMRRLVRLLLLLLLVDRGTPLQLLACAMPRPMPLRLEQSHRALPAVVMAADDEDDYDGSEESKPDEDVDLAWNRYSLEYLFQAYEVAYETAYVEEVSYEYEYVDLTDEQQAEVDARLRRNNVVNSLVGGLVACCCMATILHTYIMQVSHPNPDSNPTPTPTPTPNPNPNPRPAASSSRPARRSSPSSCTTSAS